ncbi:guanylate kinase [Candidatus Pacearchaeota archaeon]|nr:guanylate kinase [Candidatus Pacearchaeota archaeon]
MHNLFIMLGPSGSGKTTLVEAVTGENQLYADLRIPSLKRVITSTTRKPRSINGNGFEQNGQAYWFRTPTEFEQDWTSGELLERAEYKGNHYGLRKSDIVDTLTTHDGFLIMEPQGTRKMLAWKPDTHVLYLLPIAEEQLHRRMLARGASTEDIQRRLHDIPGEYDTINALVKTHNPRYIHPITNDGPVTQGIAQMRTYIESVRAH